jgi:drug/metabolite transporter (DMT)-like permease
MVKTILLVLAAEILASWGQILFKKSANALDTYELHRIEGHAALVRDVLSRPMIWSGILAMTASLVVWIFALASAELSVVFSLGSMQYIVILFTARYFLDEKIDLSKLVGTLLVVAGIALVVASH